MTGLAHLFVGSGVVASGAFDGSATSPSADFRIVVPGKRGFELRPGRDDESYVETDDDGLVTRIVLTAQGGHGVSIGAKTSFENIVEVHKLPPGPPIDELYFEFEVVDIGLVEGTDPTPAEIEAALFIAAADGDIPGDGSQNYLETTDEGDAHNDLLSPNQSVPFGVGIDLNTSGISDLPPPDRFGIDLHIRAEHLPQGPPGGSGGNNSS
jgi:hypothetical protein